MREKCIFLDAQVISSEGRYSYKRPWELKPVKGIGFSQPAAPSCHSPHVFMGNGLTANSPSLLPSTS